MERPGDEIAQSIIRDSKLETPLWVCPKTESDKRNVLVAVDGSESSLRAVDHAGYILSDQDQHNIILVHVRTGTGTSSHDIFQRAEAILRDHGIPGQRIETFSTWGLSVAGAIENIVRQHRQAAVAIGLHGSKGGWLKNFNLAGKTTASLIGKLENVSIWCCP